MTKRLLLSITCLALVFCLGCFVQHRYWEKRLHLKVDVTDQRALIVAYTYYDTPKGEALRHGDYWIYAKTGDLVEHRVYENDFLVSISGVPKVLIH